MTFQKPAVKATLVKVSAEANTGKLSSEGLDYEGRHPVKSSIIEFFFELQQGGPKWRIYENLG